MQQILLEHLRCTIAAEKKLDIVIEEAERVFATRAIKALIAALVVLRTLETRIQGFVKRRLFALTTVLVEESVIQKRVCASVDMVEKEWIAVYIIADSCTDGVSHVMKNHVRPVIQDITFIQKRRLASLVLCLTLDVWTVTNEVAIRVPTHCFRLLEGLEEGGETHHCLGMKTRASYLLQFHLDLNLLHHSMMQRFFSS
jgi:hypothetical protein